jgi:thiol-disulfide isomerase/thioredoxin
LYKYIKRLLLGFALSVIIFYLFVGCTPTVPDGGNGGTGGEGEQETSGRVVMVELFVAPTCSRCPAAKLAIDSLSNKYGLDQIVILEEYGWDDPHGILRKLTRGLNGTVVLIQRPMPILMD